MPVPRVARLAAAAQARQRHYPDVEANNIKYRLPALDGLMDRRSLFKALKLERQVIPAVNSQACAGSLGCDLCLLACPNSAIDRIHGLAVIKPELCLGCGACMPDCPTGAVIFPGFTSQEQSAGLAALLPEGEAGLSAPVIAYVCGKAERASARMGDEVPYPAELLPVLVPSLAAIGLADLLEPFVLGCAAVVLVGYGSDETNLLKPENVRLQQLMGYVEGLVRGDAEAHPRVARFDLRVDRPDQLMDALAAFCDQRTPLQSRSLSPTPVSVGETVAATKAITIGSAAGPLRAAALVRALVHKTPLPVSTAVDSWSPFGTVEVNMQFCTMCGLCASHCPTAALSFVSTAEQESLHFQVDGCLACGLCVRVCPEKSLQVKRMADPAVLDQPSRELARAVVNSCRKCGHPLPNDLLQLRHSLHLGPQAALCPSCRINLSLSGWNKR